MTSAPVTLDCKGLRCPMPVIKLSLAMKALTVGDTIRVEATDQAFHPDVVAWARQLGHRLVHYEAGATQVALIEKGERPATREGK